MSERAAHEVLDEVLTEFSDADKWADARFGAIRVIPNTKVGDVGQRFVERLCKQIGFEVAVPRKEDGQRVRQSPWDIKIESVTFELKTASEDTGNNFQFNHIRYAREYKALLCVGIAPADVLFDAWTKADVTTGKAGKLISMEKSGTASYKLTKSKAALRPMDEFEGHVLDIIAQVDSAR